MDKERINLWLENYDYNFTINKPEEDTFYGQSVTEGITGAMLIRNFEFINKELQVTINDRVLEMDNDEELDPDLIPDPEDALIKPDLKLVKSDKDKKEPPETN